MVQIIEENRSPTTTERFNKAFGNVVNTASGLSNAMQQNKNQKALMEQENEAAKRIGIDLSGISDPKMRQEAVAYALKGMNETQLEQLKQMGKENQTRSKQDFLGKLFGGNQQQQPQSQQSQQGFDPGKISDADIAQATSLDPALGRELRAAKDTALRENRLNKKESPEYKRDEQIAKSQAQADIKYNQELQSSKRQHEIKNQTLNRLEELNKKGVTGKPYEKLLEKFGLIALTSEGRREYAAEQKNLITDIRSILGSQFSTFEFQTILNAFPSPDFSQEANAAIIKNLKGFQNIKDQEYIIANELKKENGGKLPADYQTKVNERVQEYAQSKLPEIKENTRKIMEEQYGVPKGHTLLIDPKGELMSVPDDEVEQLIEFGAQRP